MENIAQPKSVRSQITVWFMRIACWRYKETYAQSEYVTLTAVSL